MVYIIDQLKPRNGHQIPLGSRRYKINLLLKGDGDSNQQLFYIYNRGPWQNTDTQGPYKGYYSIGDSYNISSDSNSLEGHNEFLGNLGASLKNAPDMSVSITGMMTGNSGDAGATDSALKRAKTIKDALVNFGASQDQINIGSPVGDQSENSTQIKVNATFNVPDLPIKKSQIINVNKSKL
ncbi:hypothetical protein QE422_001989 [Chryseobacterium sp. SORGH_AS 447]|uniref:hypothetical protein n=1 Tax=Chryseobacterium sp. SORGH_AS_0447 TaxID=3041769 RepID=UPI002780B727|nr:hypothetical protein [Chryseobacterium sp. SORGH_AS_0447]MDQ1161621.1 hypothetical protein [Chryseobacterium sp. SORGH_AS_0447]